MAAAAENTLLLTLEDGPVTIELLPDLAPRPRDADQGTGAGRLL